MVSDNVNFIHDLMGFNNVINFIAFTRSLYPLTPIILAGIYDNLCILYVLL